ncbi:glycoside hydrolase superfamily [Aspergillus novoparasiticus]|uniref:chitinase n=1 Tax=Aspergillus novoparasiticus TaxID=986946 RepID=A0A5N6EQ04_9EURO|nr:glycoside hydrolase superfamily [Aspergillus novoparasiticus]
MYFTKSLLALAMAAASLGGAYAKLDLSSTSNVVVYWGQNSFKGEGELAQQPLGYYCNDENIDVIVLAFLMTINGLGGAPEIDFSNANDNCTTFDGTNLLKCPQIGADINTCQKKGKTILLSIGGATYSEGGFQSESAAKAGADLLWKTFGPPTTQGPFLNATAHNGISRYHNGRFNRLNRVNSTDIHAARANSTAVRRPFGDATIDGFDFDFEAPVKNMAPFANRLRELSDADKSKQYFLTAAPQCPYPDAADKDILNGPVSIDAVFVQFYNNWCGVNSFSAGQQKQSSFNFEQWDNWAKTVSQNKKAKVLLGVPANTSAASTGYIPASELEPVIAYSKSFESFGGVMMWDVSQAYGNKGFLDGVKGALRNSTAHLLRHGFRLPSFYPVIGR